MALAIFAGAIFLSLLYRPASFYCAVQQFEAKSLADRETGGARLLRTSWQDLIKTVQGVLNQGTVAQRRDALESMFRAIVGSASGGIDAASAMDAKRKDPHNDLSTLAAAMVILAADADAAPPTGGPGERARNDFQKLSSIIELVPWTGVAALFQSDLAAAQRAVYGGHFSRSDAAAIAAEAVSPFSVRTHWQALPLIQKRLATLAGNLDAAGQPAEAARCRRWFRHVMWELIDREPDAPNRLLFLDLMARDLPEKSPARQTLERIRDEYVDKAADAPMDRMDPSGSRTSAAPDVYRTTQDWLVASLVLALAAAGAGGAFVSSMVVGRFVRQNALEPRVRSFKSHLVLCIVAQAVLCLCAFIAMKAASPRGPMSDHWSLLMAIASVLLGFSVSLAFSGFHDSAEAHPAWPMRMGFLLPIATAVLFVLPPIWFTQFARAADRWMHTMWTGIIMAALLGAIGMVLNARRAKFVRRTASRLCCTSILLALCLYGMHAWADSNLIEAGTRGRLGEFEARLGSDWKQRYLAPIKNELLGEGS